MQPFTPKYTIKDMQELAVLRGGRCLSKEYWNNHTKLSWKCEKGHSWDALHSIIVQGSWYPQCTKAKRSKIILEEMQQIAKSRGGKCLSKEYINATTKLKWQCKQGHIWETTPNGVKNRGAWCPYCAHKAKLTIEEMQQIAKSRRGKCLSDKYINDSTKLKWECKEGHIWEAQPHAVKGRSSWCPYCWNHMRLTIEEMQQIAKSRGGKCLSDKYVNAKTKLKWQCQQGHIWKTVPMMVKRGSWCPYCSGNKKLPVKKFIQEQPPAPLLRGNNCI